MIFRHKYYHSQYQVSSSHFQLDRFFPKYLVSPNLTHNVPNLITPSLQSRKVNSFCCTLLPSFLSHTKILLLPLSTDVIYHTLPFVTILSNLSIPPGIIPPKIYGPILPNWITSLVFSDVYNSYSRTVLLLIVAHSVEHIVS